VYVFDPVLIELFRTWEVQCWKDTLKRYPEDHRFYEEARDWAMLDGFTYGVMDADMEFCTAFSFSGNRIENNKRSRAVLQCLVPHLSEALKRMPGPENEKAGASAASLTPREVEILNWLKEGRASSEISSVLRISERTVNFHVQNLKGKLNAMSRAHAVAIAASRGIIDL
jgi:DNA-binding CsgD family transcriptional regulator